MEREISEKDYIDNVLKAVENVINDEDQATYEYGWNDEIVLEITKFICDNVNRLDGDIGDVSEEIAAIVYIKYAGVLPPEMALALVIVKIFRKKLSAVCKENFPA